MTNKTEPANQKHGQAGRNNQQLNYNKPPTKREKVLEWLIQQSKQKNKVTRFDAESIGDHCLNTSIHEITSNHGVKIERQSTKRPTRFGKPVTCKEYWISGCNIVDAYKVLCIMKARRAT